MTDVSYGPATNYPPDDISGALSRYRRHLPIVIGVTLLGLAVAWGVTKLMTPRYTATVYLQFQPSQALLSEQTDLGAAGSTQTPEQVVQTQTEIMRSPSLIDTVIADLNLKNDPYFRAKIVAHGARTSDALSRLVENSYDVSRVKLTNVFQIRYTDPDPVQAARLANAFAQGYIEQQLQRKRSLVTGGNALVSSQVNELRRAADIADAAVQNYRVAHNLVSAEGDTIAAQEVSSLNQQLAAARAQEAEAKARANAAHRAAASVSGGQDVGAALESTTISDLRQQRATVSQNLAALQARYGDRYPEVIRARQSLADIDGQIQQEVTRILTNLDAEGEIATERRESLENSLNSSRTTLSAGASASVGLADLQRTADAAKAQYQAVLDRSNMTDSQTGLVQPDAQITSPATPPASPSSPNLWMNLALGALVGFLLGFLVALVRERWETGMGTLDDIEQQLGCRFFGSMPTVKSSVKKPGERSPIDQVVAHPLSGYAEAFRNLAVSACYSPDGKLVKVIALTSALPQEGKTTAAICLARVLAMANAKVLMVDCDLRRRSMTQALRAEHELGLVELLQGKASLSQVLVRDEASGAYILPLARGSENAFSPFNSDAMDKLLTELRTRFDAIILDTAPVLAVVDTRMLAPKVDSLILLVRWRKTPAKAARAAMHMIEGSGGQVSGAALSVVNLKAQAQSKYGDGSNYYYKSKSYYTS